MKIQEHFRARIIRRFMNEDEFVEFQELYNNNKIPDIGRRVLSKEHNPKKVRFDF